MSDHNLQFLRDKVTSLGTALMHTYSEDIVQFPNCIVEATSVDEDGSVWLTCERPQFSLITYPACFPARLSFYKKGIDYRLEVSGSAVVMEPSLENGQTSPFLLIRVQIREIEYTGLKEKKKSNLETTVEKGYRWLLKNVGFTRSDKPVLARLHINHG